ncbi:Complement C1q-like protein 4 [Mactra antiquata]
MAATLSVLLLVFMLKSSTCTPVGQLPVEGRLDQLEIGAEVQYERTNDLEQRLSVLEKFVVGMLSSNNSSQTGNSALSKEEIGNLLENLSEQVDTNYSMPILPGIGALRQFGAPKVAFHSYISANRAFSPNEVVIFDQVMNNDGVGYTAADGLFDAPTTGTYVFTWTITAAKFGHPVTTQLMVNGEMRGVLTSESDYTTTGATGTGSHPATAVVVTHVNMGEHVFLRVSYPQGGTSSFQSNSLDRSTFSGWLL